MDTSRAFWPAGKVAKVNPYVPFNNSISPINDKPTSSVEVDVELEVEIRAKEKDEDGDIETDIVIEPVPEPGEDFEIRKPRIGRKPVLPKKAEVDEHFPLHLNYRTWCKHCVAGKARLAQHKTGDPDRERLGITWNADIAFMGSEEAEEGMQPTLVMYDDDKKLSLIHI